MTDGSKKRLGGLKKKNITDWLREGRKQYPRIRPKEIYHPPDPYAGWNKVAEEDDWETSDRLPGTVLHHSENEFELELWMDDVEKRTGHKPDETEVYTQADVSRTSFTRWKKSEAGAKVSKAITDTMAKSWSWNKREGGWTVTVHVMLTILRSIS